MRAFLPPWLLTLVWLGLSACHPAALTPDALAAYSADPANGLKQVQQIRGMEVSVGYQPTDLLVARDLSATTPSQAVVDSLRHKYAPNTYFLVSISRQHHELLQPQAGFSEYSSLLQQLAFQMGDQVRVVTSAGDTLLPTNYYLDRTYASANASQLLFAFPALPPAGEWDFCLRECGLNTGNLSFRFDARRVGAAPHLILH